MEERVAVDHEVIANWLRLKTLPFRPGFLLDTDIEFIFGATIEQINKAVKKHPRRFPDDLAFRLTKEETEILGIDRSSEPKTPDLPYGFTRVGCERLCSALNLPAPAHRMIQVLWAISLKLNRDLDTVLSVLNDMMQRSNLTQQEIKRLQERNLQYEAGYLSELSIEELPSC